MREDALADQRDLVERIEEAGWEVTETECSVYESPWVDGDDPEATVTITARKLFPVEEGEDDGGDSPFRVK